MSALVVAAMLQGTAAPTVGLAKLSQHELNAMSTQCGTPERWLRVKRNGEVTFHPPPNAKLKNVVCLIRKLRPTGATKIGYIGNDAYEAGK